GDRPGPCGRGGRAAFLQRPLPASAGRPLAGARRVLRPLPLPWNLGPLRPGVRTHHGRAGPPAVERHPPRDRVKELPMSISPLAGKPAPKELFIDVAKLEREYHERKPDPGDPDQPVVFGTSGHRGTPGNGTFTEAHILAITQAICDYRRGRGTTGPLYMGKDTHALSGPAQRTALEVLAANGVETIIQRGDEVTP